MGQQGHHQKCGWWCGGTEAKSVMRGLSGLLVQGADRCGSCQQPDHKLVTAIQQLWDDVAADACVSVLI